MEPAAPGEDRGEKASINLQLRRTGDEDGGPPERYRPAWCGNPKPTGRSLIGWGSWSQRHQGRIGFHSRIRNPSVHLQLRRTGHSIAPRKVWKPQPNWTNADWLGFVEPAPPREDRVPSPDQKFFYTSATPTNRGRKR